MSQGFYFFPHNIFFCYCYSYDHAMMLDIRKNILFRLHRPGDIMVVRSLAFCWFAEGDFQTVFVCNLMGVPGIQMPLDKVHKHTLIYLQLTYSQQKICRIYFSQISWRRNFFLLDMLVKKTMFLYKYVGEENYFQLDMLVKKTIFQLDKLVKKSIFCQICW